MKYIIVLTLVLAGCASPELAREQRKAEYVEVTGVSADAAYSATVKYLAKNLGDSNAAIKHKDEKSRQIILHGNTLCNNLRQTGDVNDYRLQFTMDFAAKDKKARFSFEDLQMIAANGGTLGWDYLRLTSQESVNKIKPCLEGVKSGIVAAIKQSDF